MTGLYKFPEYEQHPIAIALMPGGMDEPEFEAFCADVEARGVIMPVTIYEGKVLDGWHRYRAAKRTGCAFKEIQYDGKDPAGYIASVNVLRRKLSSLQRALVGAKLHREHGLTQREACKKLGISNEVVTLVLKAMDSKNTMLIKRIESSADFTRGMLKEELEDAGLLRNKSEKIEAPAGAANDLVNLFNPRNKKPESDDDVDDILGGNDTDGIGDDTPLPEVGKKNTHPERKAKKTAAQMLSEQFKALMQDEKESFLQLIFPEAKPILESLGLLGEADWPFGKDKKPAKKAPAKKAKKEAA
jgi:ParB-like chromosome segregation protein Spo0J